MHHQQHINHIITISVPLEWRFFVLVVPKQQKVNFVFVVDYCYIVAMTTTIVSSVVVVIVLEFFFSLVDEYSHFKSQ